MDAAGIRDDAEKHKSFYEWKKQHLTSDQVKLIMDNEGRFSGIPAIPSDIGYRGASGKETGGKEKSVVVSQVASNPGPILGMGLTPPPPLLGMLRSSFVGDKLGAQKHMQYRTMAKFFTVTALVAGVTFHGATYEDEEVPKSTAILHKR
ncbi:unnamed protein product [Heligmosomoides polygyrus]|uniref:HIG1 domain-containing protein n=1 Tax=Heligmosomoides polygyrus TaxID=6339 RepID=A0A183GQU9_HELPZ|nr:unnamed protein product [Heligmosomoides polygyrus]